jgi:hypothetical protein
MCVKPIVKQIVGAHLPFPGTSVVDSFLRDNPRGACQGALPRDAGTKLAWRSSWPSWSQHFTPQSFDVHARGLGCFPRARVRCGSYPPGVEFLRECAHLCDEVFGFYQAARYVRSSASTIARPWRSGCAGRRRRKRSVRVHSLLCDDVYDRFGCC